MTQQPRGSEGKAFDHWGQPFDLWQKLFDGISIEGISDEDLTRIGGNFKKCLIEYANDKDAVFAPYANFEEYQKAWETLHDETKAKLLAVEKENGELKETVKKVWSALDCKAYEDAKGKTIWELVASLKAELEAARSESKRIVAIAGKELLAAQAQNERLVLALKTIIGDGFHCGACNSVDLAEKALKEKI